MIGDRPSAIREAAPDASRRAQARSGGSGARVSGRPELLFILLLGCALANYGLPCLGARVRLTEVCVAALCAVYLARARAGREAREGAWARLAPPVWLLGGGYLIAAVLCAGWSGLGRARFEVEAALVLLLALRWGRRLSDATLTAAVAWATLAAGFGALALAAGGARAVWFSPPDAAWRVIPFDAGAAPAGGLLQLGGFFGHKSFLAAFLILTLPVLAGALLDARSRGRRPAPIGQRALAVCALLVGLATLAAAQSLAGGLCAAGTLGLVTLFMALPAVQSRFTRGAVAAMAVCGALTAAALLTAAAPAGSASARAYLWNEGWGLVEARPWTGIGRDAFERWIDGGFPHAHNLYLMKLVESGAMGGALFAGFMVLCLAAAARRGLGLGADGDGGGVSGARAGVCAGFIGFAIYGLADYFYNEPSLMALCWLWGGLAIGPWAALGDGARSGGEDAVARA